MRIGREGTKEHEMFGLHARPPHGDIRWVFCCFAAASLLLCFAAALLLLCCCPTAALLRPRLMTIPSRVRFSRCKWFFLVLQHFSTSKPPCQNNAATTRHIPIHATLHRRPYQNKQSQSIGNRVVNHVVTSHESGLVAFCHSFLLFEFFEFRMQFLFHRMSSMDH